MQPKLRFKGFNDEWERRTFNSFSTRVQGNDGDINLPVLTISASKGWLNQKERFNKVIAGKELKNYTLLHKGELSYNHGNSKLAKYGVIFALKNYQKALVPKVYHSFKVDKNIEAKYIECLSQGNLLDKHLRKLVSSTARMDGLLNINFNDFMNVKINIPSHEEQQKIVALFDKLDNLIDLQVKKIELLKQLKQGLLQKLFPQNNHTTPQLRFKGFNERWKIKQIKDIYLITRGKVLSKSEISPIGSYPVYSSQTINNGLLGYYNKFLFRNAITWTTDGANAGTVNYRPGKFYCTNVCGVLLSDKGYANNCMAEIINSVAFKYVSKVGNPKLMNNVMANIIINVPCLLEQQKISALFAKLDHLIELQNHKLELLKELKKGYLQKMFI